ncbi:MAG TPA: DUF1952 domain-containing protein [Dehalococcoidia bacterium]|nr:DUF1952 domain-containing protein [Dehalococcoidia bacterium]
MADGVVRLEVRNLPRDLISGYLVDEFGGTRQGDTVVGDGWTVTFREATTAWVGGMQVPALFIDVEGPRETDAARFLRLKTMRGGG